MSDSTKIWVRAAALAAAALLSVFVLAKYASSPAAYAGSIAVLDEKKTTVLELTAASTAASAAITMIPGDTATPIAEKLADLTSDFLLVLSAIYLEKYLLTVTGYAAFTFIFPAACLLLAGNLFFRSQACAKLAAKLVLFGLAICLVIPASIGVSNMIEASYETSLSSTVEEARQTTDTIEENTQQDSDGVFSWIISKVGGGVANITEKVRNVLNNFIEALAVMLVTSCVIPLLVLLFFLWLIRLILGVDIRLPAFCRPRTASAAEKTAHNAQK